MLLRWRRTVLSRTVCSLNKTPTLARSAALRPSPRFRKCPCQARGRNGERGNRRRRISSTLVCKEKGVYVKGVYDHHTYIHIISWRLSLCFSLSDSLSLCLDLLLHTFLALASASRFRRSSSAAISLLSLSASSRSRWRLLLSSSSASRRRLSSSSLL